MTTSSPLLSLPDGRQLGYSEFGDPRGWPVIYCHGFPASRLEARFADEAAARTGVRLLSFDRPGYGLSSAHAGRRISDWAADVAVAANRLGIGRFGLLGVSGGTPFALACGALLGERVEAVAIVAGLGSIHRAADRTGFNPFARASFWLAQAMPALSRTLNQSLAPLLRRHTDLTLAQLAARLPPPDRAVLAKPENRAKLTASLREAFRQGGAAAAHELVLYANAWDFELDHVRSPCCLWHGERDTTVPVVIGRRLATALPRCEAQFLSDEGHFSLPILHMETILRSLGSAAGF